MILRVYYIENPSLSVRMIGIKVGDNIKIFKGFNSLNIIKNFCSKINKLNLVKLVVYDDNEIFPIKILALKSDVYCKNFFELDNKLTKIVIKDYFRNRSLEELAKFFDKNLCSKTLIENFVFSNNLGSLENCIKKDLEFLSEIYKKLEMNIL